MTAPDLTAAAAVIDAAHDVVDAATRAPRRDRAVPTPTRCSPTTSPTPPPPSRPAGRCSTTAPRATSRRSSPAPSSPTPSPTSPAKLFGREAEWGVEPGALDGARAVRRHLPRPRRSSPSLADTPGPRHLDDDFELVQDTFRRFAEDKIRPVAEHVHRDERRHPRGDHLGLAEIGGFGLSVPEEYGGFAERRRERLPRHGRRHRGAVAGLARRRRLAHHPARDPHPGPASRAAPRSRSSDWLPKLATGRGHGRAWPSPSPTTAPTSPA